MTSPTFAKTNGGQGSAGDPDLKLSLASLDSSTEIESKEEKAQLISKFNAPRLL